jgi:hypothetical protein
VQPLDSAAIKASFVNISRSRLASMSLPGDLEQVDWSVLDFLGWRDPKAPARAYLVVPHQGRTIGLALRGTQSPRQRRGSALCNLCHTGHPAEDVGLFVAPRTGAAGRNGDTVGTYICADLACPLYVRGLRELALPQGETISVERRVTRLQIRLAAFVDKALAPV